ncbi:hypothetical protein BP6252_12954 [Coleophoma cylindrospora]|uniref:Uncharacterized protein n=1 Tax=Coleophoma cylindrospora TaxID=1849047 RepID=A0A3D8QDR4_9HELO|nr:hypothetical protein BP6252_12954 [Coleophoma cylindrospora]
MPSLSSIADGGVSLSRRPKWSPDDAQFTACTARSNFHCDDTFETSFSRIISSSLHCQLFPTPTQRLQRRNLAAAADTMGVRQEKCHAMGKGRGLALLPCFRSESSGASTHGASPTALNETRPVQRIARSKPVQQGAQRDIFGHRSLPLSSKSPSMSWNRREQEKTLTLSLGFMLSPSHSCIPRCAGLHRSVLLSRTGELGQRDGTQISPSDALRLFLQSLACAPDGISLAVGSRPQVQAFFLFISRRSLRLRPPRGPTLLLIALPWRFKVPGKVHG